MWLGIFVENERVRSWSFLQAILRRQEPICRALVWDSQRLSNIGFDVIPKIENMSPYIEISMGMKYGKIGSINGPYLLSRSSSMVKLQLACLPQNLSIFGVRIWVKNLFISGGARKRYSAEKTYYRWRRDYESLIVEQAKRLKKVEK
jgi:hypothetical protein